MAQVAQFGFASLTLYLLAVATFLVPSAVAVSELGARMPDEGGFYLWIRTAFGDFHGFVAAWSYWLCNVVWFPTVILLFTTALAYAGGEAWAGLADDPWYAGLVGGGVLWLVTGLNILGLERAKWIPNVGAIGTWVCVTALAGLGAAFVLRHGSAHPFSPGKLVPDLGDLDVLPYFAMAAFGFGGLELAPVMAGEARDPVRDIPRAIVTASLVVTLFYVAGTLALVLTVPEGDVGIIAGVAQAFLEIERGLGLPGVGAAGALLLALSSLGLLASWMTGNARLPFVVGLDRYLPAALARVHPRWGSPWVSLLAQGVALSLLYPAAVAGATVKEAFLVLLDMSILLYFIPFLYLFAAFVRHVVRDTGGAGVFPLLRRSPAAAWAIGSLGFLITLLSTVLSAVPSGDVDDGRLFVIKVVGGSALLLAAGLVVYALHRHRE